MARERILWPFLLAGFASLLVAAHFDSIRGPLLPPVARELQLEFGDLGWFLAACHVAATLATGLLLWALNRWPERRITVATGVMGCACAAFSTMVSGFTSLMVLGVLVGCTISTMGAMSNVLVIEGSPPALKGRLLAGLHAMYGFGSMAASWATAAALRADYHWSWLYLLGVPGLVGLIAFAALAMRPGTAEDAAKVSTQSPALSAFQLLVVAIIAIYVAGESSVSIWLPSYLVHVAGYSDAGAATTVTGYFGVLTATRVACFLLIEPRREKPVLILALVLPLVAFAIGYAGNPAAFMGMGAFGAFFPVLLARVSRKFPRQWRAITVWSMTAMQVTIGTSELVLGKAADVIGIKTAFLLPAALLTVSLILLTAYFIKEHKKV